MAPTVEAVAPARIDLAGGTLDIWPVYLMLDGPVTVNLGLGLPARARVTPAGRGRFVLRSLDHRSEESFRSRDAMLRGAKHRLAAEAIRAIPVDGAVVETSSGVPPGSGLGGSSALAVALCAALRGAAGDRRELALFASDMEGRVIQVPPGSQDHLAAAFGGLSAWHYGPGGVRREPLPGDARALARCLVLCYTGVTHSSAVNNWRVTKAFLDGDRAVRRGFAEVAAAAVEVRAAVLRGDLRGIAAGKDRDSRARNRRGGRPPLRGRRRGLHGLRRPGRGAPRRRRGGARGPRRHDPPRGPRPPRRAGPAAPVKGLRAVFLDLDDTLLDTAGILLGPARLEAGAAMVAAGLPGTPEAAAAGLARIARSNPGEDPFALLAGELGADPMRVGVAGWGAFYKRKVPDAMPLVDGAAEALRSLRARGVRLFLVTFGDVATQESKVRATGVTSLVDRVVYEPLGPAADKGRAFRAICEEENLDPKTCAAIGDRPDAEIAAGRALGMFTVRVRRGEHAAMEGAADRTVATFAEAAGLLTAS
jgi:D-glycero-alpha-D-manno-heptose-7-phosphate kinase